MKQPSLSWPTAAKPDRDQIPTSLAPAIPRRLAATAAQNGQRIALSAILLLAAFLNLFRLDAEGYANGYYAAAVKSMLQSWHTFFFVSFDPGGLVSVDKPPLGFWIQTASAKVLGFSGVSILLPQAIAGILSVGLLYVLVRRVFGVPAGLLSALTLAVTPVAVAVNRNNTIDSLLIFVLLAAIWAVSNAIERDSLRWLLLGAVFVGLGFNVKMMQAYLVLPALALAYLLGSRGSWRTRLGRLACAGVGLAVVSLAWAVVVDLTPANLRTYVGSSPDNSALNLALGYNGLFRLLPSDWLPAALTGPNMGRGGGPGGGFPGGSGGPDALRLLSTSLAGQISWLLPLALVGGLVAWCRERTRLPLSQRQTALVIWGGWCATGVVFFSVATSFTLMHRYYLAMLAAPIAALVGIGLTAMWSAYRAPRDSGGRGARVQAWALPVCVAGTALLAAWILRDYPDQSRWLTPVVLVLGIGAAAGLVVLRLRANDDRVASRWLPAVAAVALVAMLLTPTVWAGYTPFQGSGGAMPTGGPATAMGWGMPPGAAGGDQSDQAEACAAMASRRGPGGFGSASADPRLVPYLKENRQGETFLLATESSMSASPIILATGEPVAALGGFSGGDAILTDAQLADMVARGEVRYFLVPVSDASGDAIGPASGAVGDSDASATDTDAPGGGFPGRTPSNTTLWVNANCTAVPTSEWQSTDAGGPGGRSQLFDCADMAQA